MNSDLFKRFKDLWEQAEEHLVDAERVLLAIWLDTKDGRIEDFFSRHGGTMIDGEFKWGKQK